MDLSIYSAAYPCLVLAQNDPPEIGVLEVPPWVRQGLPTSGGFTGGASAVRHAPTWNSES